ncbi:MAG: hypothetical protein WAM01_08960 [Candidatus Acidiferrales bacterium]
MNESVLPNDAGNQKRRSTRIVQAIPLTVAGVDALGQPFKERTTTTMVNCHGCKYQSKHYVPKNSMVALEIPRPEPAFPARRVQGRVVWVQRPRTVRELFQIGLEFETPGNVWGIAFPPEDWFPLPGEETAEGSASAATDLTHELSLANAPPARSAESSAHGTASSAVAPTKPIAPEFIAPAAPVSATTVETAKPPAAAPAPADNKIHVMPSAPPTQDSQIVAQQMARMVAEAKVTLDKTLKRGAESAITEEMAIVRQQLDAQLHDAVEKAIKSSMDRVSESAAKKMVQQAAARTTAIIEEARVASQVSAGQLDSKVRLAVEQAVSNVAEQAAQQAAQQTATHNLKSAVDEAVERALREREANTPSLEILSSPQAAQNHLDAWRKNLEEAAHSVHSQIIEQTNADSEAAKQRWQENFKSALSGATQTLDNRIQEASQSALVQAEAEASVRATAIRSSLDEAIASARATIESMSAGLQQERAQTEETKGRLTVAANAAIEQARQRLSELLAVQYEEIGRKTDEIVAERARQLEPVIEASAQKTADRVSAEFDQKLAPKLAEVQQAANDLSAANQRTEELRRVIQEQARQVSAEVAELREALRSDIEQASDHAVRIQEAVHEQVQQVSQQAIEQSIERLREQTAQLPAELEENCRKVLTKAEEEFHQRSTEVQHETYESMVKAADWYQKKAQTTMQTTLERAVEQSTTSLRDRAAEISSLVASELDHYRRTYVQHSQAQIEDAAKEVVVRERERLGETAEVAAADFSDRVERVTSESIRRFENTSREALEKARSDMEFNREGSLAEFQKRLETQVMETAEQARVQLQSQIVPMMEALEEQRENQQREWIERLRRSTDESIEQYKGRLENASNSWLLASATTLGQHSQAVLDTLAKAAEKRMRETVAGVMAGMGDTLKQRLMGLSTDFGAEEDDEHPSSKSGK